jgi:putative nucleotidyltransferase-like protein
VAGDPGHPQGLARSAARRLTNLRRRGQLSEEQLLALRAALLPGEQAESAFRDWRGLVDFDSTDTPTYRLLPLIYRNLEAQLGTDPVVGRMRGIYRRTWVLNAIQLEEGERALAALSDREIPTMVLKGAAMVARWTGDSGVRMMADFDLLVPRDRALEALAKLLEDGWEPVVGRAGSLTEADLDDEHAILLRSDRRGELDLHWRGLMHAGGDASDRGLWGRAEPVRLGEVRTHVPSPEDHVHHACSHATTWSAGGRVDWIADSALIVNAVGPRFDWGRVVDLARLDRSTVAVRALTEALGEVFDETVGRVGSPRRLRFPRPELTERIELSLRGRLPHELSRSGALILDLLEHRRRHEDLVRRPLITAVPSYARKRWRVEGLFGAVVQATYAALGRPRWLRRSVVRRVRSHGFERSDLVGLESGGLDLRIEAAVRDSLLEGWSFAEPDGRWTDGAEAALALRNGAHHGDLAIDVVGIPLLHPRHPGLEVEIWANDRYVETWSYRLDEAAPASRRLVLSRESLEPDVLELAFVFREPCRPMELGLSNDPRRLGLFVSELRFSYA